ncbi:MAG: phosphatase PAP2 family protein [Lachnospiraceae bacterium]|nr:phosphatase PAP2 family protein [Lachnospiraceae bacterium]
MNWEFAVLDFIAEHFRTDIGNIIFPFLSSLADRGMIWILFSLLLLSQKKTRTIGLAALFALICMLIIGNSCLKPLIARERPFIARPEKLAYLLIAPPGEYSFPSGHTFSSFAAATTIALGNKKLGIFALILAATIGFSRLYLYVHFPTDVLGGMLLGILLGSIVWSLFSSLLSNQLLNRITKKQK